MSTRRRAREVAMQSLYQYDLNPDTSPVEITRFVAGRLRFPELETFALSLINGARQNQGEIDEKIQRTAQNWSIARMTPVDRSILRLGAFELLHEPETPTSVVLDEAIEIAKRYSTPDSPAFINGILDRIAAGARSSETQPSDLDTSSNQLPPAGD